MDRKVRELVESLHGSERMLSLAIAGAGTQAVGWILGVAGASRTADLKVSRNFTRLLLGRCRLHGHPM